MPRRSLILLLIAPVLLATCGGDADDGDRAQTKTAGRATDCEMTAAQARRVHGQLTKASRRATTGAVIVMHALTKDLTDTRTDESPDGRRDFVVLVNELDKGLAGLRGTSGSRTVSLSARPGCGAVADVPHVRSFRAQFFADGKLVGSTGPGPG